MSKRGARGSGIPTGRVTRSSVRQQRVVEVASPSTSSSDSSGAAVPNPDILSPGADSGIPRTSSADFPGFSPVPGADDVPIEEQDTQSQEEDDQGSNSSDHDSASDTESEEVEADQMAHYEFYERVSAKYKYGSWYSAESLMALRNSLRTTNFGVVDKRAAAISAIEGFFKSTFPTPPKQNSRFPTGVDLVSDADPWARSLIRIIGALSYKSGDKDVKKRGEPGSTHAVEMEQGTYSDCHKTFMYELMDINNFDMWTQERFESFFSVNWVQA